MCACRMWNAHQCMWLGSYESESTYEWASIYACECILHYSVLIFSAISSLVYNIVFLSVNGKCVWVLVCVCVVVYDEHALKIHITPILPYMWGDRLCISISITILFRFRFRFDFGFRSWSLNSWTTKQLLISSV